jgi:DnaJ family protein C protein 28
VFGVVEGANEEEKRCALDFVDYRKQKDQTPQEVLDELEKQQNARRLRGRVGSYVEEMIRDAQERGEFDNLPGAGKPLQLQPRNEADDNAMAYGILKQSGHVPPEIQILQQIDGDLARANTMAERLRHSSRVLHGRRLSIYQREKQSFNAEVEKTLSEYETALRRINSKILTLNLSTPPALHRPLLEVEKLVEQLRADCPPFA